MKLTESYKHIVQRCSLLIHVQEQNFIKDVDSSDLPNRNLEPKNAITSLRISLENYKFRLDQEEKARKTRSLEMILTEE